ncbi:MAG: hypothetical protein POH28_00485 [Acidocella sp.]|nr:hypothetical protein [Acidocella sp.]
MTLKINLMGGAAGVASFLGIGKGVAQSRRAASEPFLGIGKGRGANAIARRARAEGGDDDGMRKKGRKAQQDDSGDDDAEGDPADPGSLPDDGGDDAEGDPNENPGNARRSRRARRARKAGKASSSDPADPDFDDDANNGDDNDDDGDEPGSEDPDEDSDSEPDGEDDDDPVNEMRGRSPAAKARRKERARCAAIFASTAAARNPNMAAHLAFNTLLSRKEAIAILKTAPVAQGGVLGRAMDRYSGARAGADRAPARASTAAIASTWDHAFKAVSGK